ncbi:MAG: hypothetical protein ABSE63_04415 [Thermoguttaceae bacterium]|jgi:hypothetical protein
MTWDQNDQNLRDIAQGKLMCICMKDNTSSLFENAEFHTIGERIFVSGTEMSRSWAKGLKYMVPWDQVSFIYFPDSVEDYEQRQVSSLKEQNWRVFRHSNET